MAHALHPKTIRQDCLELKVPLFTNTLKKENEVIELGLELLKAYQADSEQGQALDPENLRAVTYAMQCILGCCHLQKKHSLLFPALCEASLKSSIAADGKEFLHISTQTTADCGLLELRVAIDGFEQDLGQRCFFRCALSQTIEQISKQLTLAHVLFHFAEQVLAIDEQRTLFHEANKIEQACGRDDRQSSRKIFNHLRLIKGMSAA